MGIGFVAACGKVTREPHADDGNYGSSGEGGDYEAVGGSSKGGKAQGGTAGIATGGHPVIPGGGASGNAGGAAQAGEPGSAGEPTGFAGAEGSAGAPPTGSYDELFDEAAFPEFRLELSQEAIQNLNFSPETYQSGSLIYGGYTYQNVGIRLKGRASQQGFWGKPAFKIKLNEFVSGQRLLGLKRLTLNNMVQDPTMMHERLGYTFFRALGLPAPRANHARVYVNGEFYGVYLNLQSLDEVFVDEQFPGAGVGNLFDITNDEYFIDFDRSSEPPIQETKYVLETNKKANDVSDLTALIDAVWASSDDTFLQSTEAHLDLEEALLLGAGQAIIADWDGYFGARNNYKVYHELGRDRFLIFPWGIDQTFWPEYVDYAIDHSQSQRPRSITYDRCAVLPDCVARYQEKVANAVSTFSTLPLAAELDTWLAQIKDAAALDTRKPYSSFERSVAVQELYSFIQERPAKVQAQLPP